MGEQATLRTYGNADLSKGTEERPLVTFSLFAYNQEDYIREAVEGAFSQTYSPLEIILSDDCSSDRTFTIMHEMALHYDGPHRILLRQSEINMGTAQHLAAIAESSHGEMIVIASGDDVSEAERTRKLVKAWLQSNKEAACVHSFAFEFEDFGVAKHIARPRSQNMIKGAEVERWLKSDLLPFLSPTCAYSRKVFDNFDPLFGGSIIEDGPMALRCLLTGSFVCIAEPLVHIRVSKVSTGRDNTILNRHRWNRFVRSQILCYMTKLNDLPRSNLDFELRKSLDGKYRRKIRALSKFVSPEPKNDFMWKIAFLYSYIFNYAFDVKMKYRLSGALDALGYADTQIYISASKFYKALSKNREQEDSKTENA